MSVNIEADNPANEPPLEFAAEELQKYTDMIFKENSACPELKFNISIDKSLNAVRDEFRISSSSGWINLEGANPRAALFAAYAFLEEYLQVRWHHAGDETIPESVPEIMEIKTKTYSADFADRGFNLETYHNEHDMKLFIDWMAKNRMNNAAMPFRLWDDLKNAVYPEIQKRGLKLSLSGHSYFHFLPREKYFSEHQEWFALTNGKRMEKGQLCFSNQECQDTFCKNVLSFLKEQPHIDRLSIWPADNKYCCECEECSKQIFLESYIQLISKLKDYLETNGFNTEIDHLAYNASLEDAMLAPPESGEPLSIDTQLAFWGRDYSQPLEISKAPSDINAKKHIEDWAKLHGKGENGLHILEYYTDYWMLTSLYPPLAEVIPEDMRFYKKIGTKGMFTLGVACQYGPFKGKNYPWQWRQGLNLYLFAKYCWNTENDIKELLADYFTSYYGDCAEEAEKIFVLLENSLAPLTAFNIPLFRLRFPDIWQRDETPEDGGTRFVPSAWTPQQTPNCSEKERMEVCEKLTEKLTAATPLQNAEENQRFEKLLDYFDYAKNKIRSLSLQLQAQKSIREGNGDSATEKLTEALALENKMFGENSEDCEKWLNKLKAGLEN